MEKNRIWLLDYDHTLAMDSHRAYTAMNERINEFVQNTLNLTAEAANHIRKKYVSELGTTLEGLRTHHNVDPEEFFDYIHQIPDEAKPGANPGLKDWIQNQNIPMYIFTNARADWAIDGLKSMGISHVDHFNHILDLRFLGWRGKPHQAA